jgi:transposase InsO family protein
VLDDFSRYIIAWKLCTTMRADDITATLDLALDGPGSIKRMSSTGRGFSPTLIQRRRHHGDTDLRLGSERHGVGNICRFSTLRVLDPVLREIEAAVDQGMSFRTRITNLPLLSAADHPVVVSAQAARSNYCSIPALGVRTL